MKRKKKKEKKKEKKRPNFKTTDMSPWVLLAGQKKSSFVRVVVVDALLLVARTNKPNVTRNN